MTSDEERRLRHVAAEAVRDADPARTEAWASLGALSSATRVDSLEVFEDEILLGGEGFRGSVLWHVTLVYNDPEGPITLTNSFPGHFEGVFRGEEAEVHRVTADTSSFYL
jgi:hypothetical protein